MGSSDFKDTDAEMVSNWAAEIKEKRKTVLEFIESLRFDFHCTSDILSSQIFQRGFHKCGYTRKGVN